MNVQIFGSNKSKDTQKALRFFKERQIKPHYVDLQQRAIAAGELRHFVQKYGLEALLNTSSKAYQDAGLEYLRLSEAQLSERLQDEPALMIQPLVRSGTTLSVGWDEALWRDWYRSAKH